MATWLTARWPIERKSNVQPSYPTNVLLWVFERGPKSNFSGASYLKTRNCTFSHCQSVNILFQTKSALIIKQDLLIPFLAPLKATWLHYEVVTNNSSFMNSSKMTAADRMDGFFIKSFIRPQKMQSLTYILCTAISRISVSRTAFLSI